ncbi:sugar ABC transporter ATP-binding protein [Paenibacillus frigoriresistens]|uniref:sugar ABC transporter ATP-binding protein n=1 Tax=Paenibacillus alginolyticus TaxID=59839 RepID=UPI001562EEF1|nr:sugar ABC transporter ATP-binding protein [Paenibacillus frigoriresistens]NRF95675.1 sugar ABC transporter ATP-binding protein [Paenibacillus frigoriresistens]
MHSVLLEMNLISKSFSGVRVLKDVNFNVLKGEVMALVGENGAGKSTLMKIIAGVHQKDNGDFRFDGQAIHHLTPKQSRDMGIRIIHQELNLAPNMSVAENMFMGMEHRRNFFFWDKAEAYKESNRLLQVVGLSIDPNTLVQELSIAQRQLVEIARALSLNAKLIIMDEPTSSLTENESVRLLDIVRRLKTLDVSIVYISHKLEEIYQMADRITVLRDGVTISTVLASDCPEDELIRMMVGREVKDVFAKRPIHIGDPILEVKGLSAGDKVRNIDFSLRQGEILGFAGLVGAGRSEVMRAIFGIDRIESGEIKLSGNAVTIKCPQDAISLGIGFVPEDRKTQGLLLGMSVKENITISSLEKVSDFKWFMNGKREADVTNQFIENLSIKTSSPNQYVSNLSGGNQQKVVLAKWLAIKPRILIVDEPTRGVDINAKKEIYAEMNRLAREGVGIIMVSSDLTEILGMSDRILVMHEGSVRGEFSSANATQENITYVAFGNH